MRVRRWNLSAGMKFLEWSGLDQGVVRIGEVSFWFDHIVCERAYQYVLLCCHADELLVYRGRSRIETYWVASTSEDVILAILWLVVYSDQQGDCEICRARNIIGDADSHAWIVRSKTATTTKYTLLKCTQGDV